MVLDTESFLLNLPLITGLGGWWAGVHGCSWRVQPVWAVMESKSSRLSCSCSLAFCGVSGQLPAQSSSFCTAIEVSHINKGFSRALLPSGGGALLLLPGRVSTAVGKQELEPASHRDLLLVPKSLLCEISEQCEECWEWRARTAPLPLGAHPSACGFDLHSWAQQPPPWTVSRHVFVLLFL